MTAVIVRPEPVPVVGWGDDRAWLAGRNRGISASDVGGVLGFSQYATPWEVWAEKTGIRPRSVDANKEAIRLGVALEPWLLVQARHLLGAQVKHTEARLYAHHDDRWQLASPDGVAMPDDGEPYGIECKTAGLAGGFGAPDGWTDDRVPLGYELQARWQMRVMGWRKVAIVALIANLGLRTYEINRDLRIELDMVDQVAEWRQRHLIEGVEPAMGRRDNGLMDDLHPDPTEDPIRLDDDPDILELVFAYQSGVNAEAAGRAEKEAALAAIKRKIGPHCAGTVDNREVITWKTRRGPIRWKEFAAQLHAAAGYDARRLEEDAETYRAPTTRTITVRGMP